MMNINQEFKILKIENFTMMSMRKFYYDEYENISLWWVWENFTMMSMRIFHYDEYEKISLWWGWEKVEKEAKCEKVQGVR